MSNHVSVGIIGGGLMGREVASAFARWCALTGQPVVPRLVAVADPNPAALSWFEQLPGVRLLTADHRQLLADPEVEVVYAAVPHHLHEAIYLDTLAAGKDLLAEKPFGIDLAAARRIVDAIAGSNAFVRCSSEFPFFPGPQRIWRELAAGGGGIGRVLEVVGGFHHASDLDPDKPANWKRLSASCGEIGVMGDLGMHVTHLPLRLGWRPERVLGQLTRGHAERPDGRGGRTRCDTWDNALVHGWTTIDGEPVPLRLEMKRLAPGATNTWFFEVTGTDGGFRYSTADTKALWRFRRQPEQGWERLELGFQTAFPTVTGGIFEPGFPDVIQQMWAAYLSERAGVLNGRFGCVTPEEALTAHACFDAALRSHQSGRFEDIDPQAGAVA